MQSAVETAEQVRQGKLKAVTRTRDALDAIERLSYTWHPESTLCLFRPMQKGCTFAGVRRSIFRRVRIMQSVVETAEQVRQGKLKAVTRMRDALDAIERLNS